MEIKNPKQGFTVVKSTPNQSILSNKSSMTCQITSETLKIPDLSKAGLADILDIPRKGKITIKPYAKVPDCPYRREDITKNINWKRFVEF